MCGISGLVHYCICNPSHSTPTHQNALHQNALCQKDHDSAAAILKQSIKNLQHRGYDGSGMAVVQENGRMVSTKGCGKIDDVIPESFISSIRRVRMGIAHTRYKTSGYNTTSHTQPIENDDVECFLVHNGHVHNKNNLKELSQVAFDSEMILKMFSPLKDAEDKTDCIFNQIMPSIYENIYGSFACIVLIKSVGMLCFRDPNGIRPLVFGERVLNDQGCRRILVASETTVLDSLGYRFIRNIRPGECVLFPQSSLEVKTAQITSKELRPCLFEYIYLSHPDSVLDGLSVKQARQTMGQLLAKTIGDSVVCEIDCVVPVPTTSCRATQALAQELGLPYCEALVVKKKGRTFIVSGQQNRMDAVKRKFDINIEQIRGKTILIVDDSIVRGTTISRIVQLVQPFVKRIYVASIAPPIRYINQYGIDIPTQTELLAFQKTIPEIAQKIGVPQVFYNDLETICYKLTDLCPEIQGFECSLFDNKHPK